MYLFFFDKECRCWSGSTENSLSPALPSKQDLQTRVQEFKKNLHLPSHKLREIEQSTRDQSNCTLWHSVRQYRLTASYFGSIYRMKETTSPQNLVLQILGTKRFTSDATEWGKHNEAIALERYCAHQNSSGHDGLYCAPSGFVISEKYPFLGASPDGVVHDPSVPNSFGLAEVKCPYSFRNLTPIEAGQSSKFCCEVVPSGAQSALQLKHTHPYFCQVQGQMGITERSWCDFIVYTTKGLHVERINFDSGFWETELLPKLEAFFDNCLAPEIVCPVHVLGMPVRNIKNM